MHILMTKKASDLEVGETLVIFRSICENCLEPIYFGSSKRPDKKWDKYDLSWQSVCWKHEDGLARCPVKYATPIGGTSFGKTS